MPPDHRITSEAELEAVIGEPMEFVRAKVIDSLNEAMCAFIAKSPLIFLATIDEQGLIDVSPKGDPAGFVQVDGDGNLLIPERLGNRLTFGFRNILRNPQVGIIFVVPNQRETLRVKGAATLHKDPEVLADMAVKGKDALMFTHVEVRECFFHCGKAMIRSHMWQPEHWQTETRSIAARQLLGKKKRSEEEIVQTEELMAESYKNELY
ncbi:MSMEG_1061 family FMN-dependent PPOX-type flavoprotein [Stakelama tenebrarum]|uniref:Pyridoxamine 5'-phosphate oxidase family protein n=1 Tax=Stakelama tenebrarum TaxID=2711215 RepID=A0A6G6Y6L6_9SPHN|nr:MSMEG_1061 family FMN-dependent PPOX-type flavoprotein [Sphingosinithalassobacter tenebrarum]QIG80565.1 pyridoxamine 5'-phosphate oxidase family protein [Sphingosinithalassobacter tenebrarum]